jgi:hypothetical protein
LRIGIDDPNRIATRAAITATFVRVVDLPEPPLPTKAMTACSEDPAMAAARIFVADAASSDDRGKETAPSSKDVMILLAERSS